MLRQAGRDGSWTFGEVLRLARADRLISEAEYEFMERLRSVRNPYVHTRPPLSDGTLMSRVTDDLGEADLLEEDATEAVIFLLRLTGRYPFSGTEGKT